MKILARLFLLTLLACSFTACLFKEPVFSDGFAKADASLGGVWASEPEEGDPRKIEFAVCAPLDDARYVLNYAVGDKDGLYFEARPVVIRGRTLLQLRILASFSNGLPGADAERYTLLWIEKVDGGKKVSVRTLGGDAMKGKSPAQVRKELEAADSDWGKLFGEPANFHRLKDR
ncbi:MAG: hypothetical protein ABI318_00650 [Chthoniobacteraceae bacterium]